MIGRTVSYLQEIAASAKAGRVFSVITALISVAATAGIIVTHGKAAAAQSSVMSHIESQDTRGITITQVKPEGELTTDSLRLITQLPETESAIGFLKTYDYVAAANPNSKKLAVRTIVGTVNRKPVNAIVPAGTAKLSAAASQEVGLPPGVGSLARPDGPDLQVSGTWNTPPFLAELEPLAVTVSADAAPRTAEPRATAQKLDTIKIVANDASSVKLITKVAEKIAEANPPGTIQVTTSAQMAALQGAISGQLTSQTYGALMAALGAATTAISLNVWGFALARRKDFGRRRALGATRTMLVSLIVGQVTLTSCAGIVGGVATGLAILYRSASPLPGVEYVIPLAIVLAIAAMAAASIPATFAAYRDPLSELRVP